MGLQIMFGFVSFQLGFAGALQSFMSANLHHLANLANVDA